MKIKYFTGFCIFIIHHLILYPQTGKLGINTINPQGLFHIDSAGNTSETSNTEDDIIINEEGNMAIGGFPDPGIKLKLNGDLKIESDMLEEGKILVCDSDLNGNWAYKSMGELISSNNDPNTILANYPVTSTSKYMGISITLPAGKWQVNFNSVYYNSLSYSINIIWDLCQSTNVNDNTTRKGRIYSYCAPPRTYSPVTGIYFVEPTETTTYYIWAGGANFPSNGRIEYATGASLWAVLISEE